MLHWELVSEINRCFICRIDLTEVYHAVLEASGILFPSLC